MHLDRTTLQSFEDESDEDLSLQASSGGELEVHFFDNSGSKIGGSTLSTLKPEEKVSLEVVTGEQKRE